MEVTLRVLGGANLGQQGQGRPQAAARSMGALISDETLVSGDTGKEGTLVSSPHCLPQAPNLPEGGRGQGIRGSVLRRW